MKTRLCHSDDVEEGDSLGFEIEAPGTHGDSGTAKRAVFAVKKNAAIYVYENRCPHLGVELEWQEHQFLDPDGALIQCATHGALFLIEDGSCISGPCMGAQLTSVTSQIEDGEVWVEL